MNSAVILCLGAMLMGFCALSPRSALAQTDSTQTGLLGPGIQLESSAPSSSDPLPDGITQRSQYGTYERAMVRSIDEKTYKTDEGARKGFVYHVEMLSGSYHGTWQSISINATDLPWGFAPVVGDKVIIFQQAGAEQNQPVFFLDSYDRQDVYLWLFVIFITFVLLAVGTKGLKIALAVALAYFLVFELCIQAYMRHWPGILIVMFFLLAYGLVASWLMAGLNKKTALALIGTLFGGLLTYGILALLAHWSHLGILSDMQAAPLFKSDPRLDAQSLIAIGLLVAVTAVIHHLCLSIASDISKVKQMMASIGFKELFRTGMIIGRENLASALPILALVYLGLMLPNLTQERWHQFPWLKFVNQETIAQSLILPLGATLGIILSLPLCALIAATAYSRYIRVIDPLKRATGWRPEEAEQTDLPAPE